MPLVVMSQESNSGGLTDGAGEIKGWKSKSRESGKVKKQDFEILLANQITIQF